jgi:hypothetical protein
MDMTTHADSRSAQELGRAHCIAGESVRLHGLAADHHGTAHVLRASDLVERMHRLLR